MGHRVEGAQLDGGRREGRLGRLRRFRRDLHRIPELDVDLFRTMAYVEGVLSGLSCELSRPAPGCVCAFFDCGSPAATAIRADMDALPITEATGSAFSSRHAGRMHACGHDAHMAMALAAAVEVDELLSAGAAGRAKLGRSVLFVFQPAEETTGGAATVCASGVFERYRVDRIFGFHVWPDLPWGAVASCAGPLLARSSETHVHIEGVSTHIAKTYGVAAPESRDAMLAAARFVTGVRELMDRLGAEEPCLARFGLLEAGTVCNAVAGSAHVAGSARVFTDAMFDRARTGIRAVLDEACSSCGCAGSVEFADGYPPVDNDPELFALAQRALPELERVREPLLIAEDFSFYQRHLPGVFFLLGIGPSEEATDGGYGELGCARAPLHGDALMFDESVLVRGVDVYRRLLALP